MPRPVRLRALRRFAVFMLLPLDVHLILTGFMVFCGVLPHTFDIPTERAEALTDIAHLLRIIVLANIALLFYLIITEETP